MRMLLTSSCLVCCRAFRFACPQATTSADCLNIRLALGCSMLVWPWYLHSSAVLAVGIPHRFMTGVFMGAMRPTFEKEHGIIATHFPVIRKPVFTCVLAKKASLSSFLGTAFFAGLQ